ncbi:hypothetical protein J6590_022939 [Homalodisca vitripennis]|nr:hypothetical protein J6590_022939 [Homalodisca vitripennis]
MVNSNSELPSLYEEAISVASSEYISVDSQLKSSSSNNVINLGYSTYSNNDGSFNKYVSEYGLGMSHFYLELEELRINKFKIIQEKQEGIFSNRPLPELPPPAPEHHSPHTTWYPTTIRSKLSCMAIVCFVIFGLILVNYRLFLFDNGSVETVNS